MAKRRKLVWREWWEWELKIPAHMQKRFSKRDFNEIELRRMMEDETNFREDRHEGRWIIIRFREKAWEVIVEPLADEVKLEVITAYEVWND